VKQWYQNANLNKGKRRKLHSSLSSVFRSASDFVRLLHSMMGSIISIATRPLSFSSRRWDHVRVSLSRQSCRPADLLFDESGNFECYSSIFMCRITGKTLALGLMEMFGEIPLLLDLEQRRAFRIRVLELFDKQTSFAFPTASAHFYFIDFHSSAASSIWFSVSQIIRIFICWCICWCIWWRRKYLHLRCAINHTIFILNRMSVRACSEVSKMANLWPIIRDNRTADQVGDGF